MEEQNSSQTFKPATESETSAPQATTAVPDVPRNQPLHLAPASPVTSLAEPRSSQRGQGRVFRFSVEFEIPHFNFSSCKASKCNISRSASRLRFAKCMIFLAYLNFFVCQIVAVALRRRWYYTTLDTIVLAISIPAVLFDIFGNYLIFKVMKIHYEDGKKGLSLLSPFTIIVNTLLVLWHQITMIFAIVWVVNYNSSHMWYWNSHGHGRAISGLTIATTAGMLIIKAILILLVIVKPDVFNQSAYDYERIGEGVDEDARLRYAYEDDETPRVSVEEGRITL